jgi:pyruvate dehydrogenase E1 component alpha subunit
MKTDEQKVEMLRQMLRIRRFEDVTVEAYRRGFLPGLVHASIGQEAISVGVCAELGTEDYVTSTHRGHGHCIAKGVPLYDIMCEIMGRADGCCGGKGGSMHLADVERGVIGANGIVGGGVGMALGAAFSASYLRDHRVSVVFIGEGAINQGVVAETMNVAALWKLPLIYICENNGMVEYTRAEDLTAGSICARAEANGVHAESIDGMDPLVVGDAARRAVDRARAGEGPTFIEALTYRFHGHHVAEFDHGYRTREEIAAARLRDPVELFKRSLVDAGVLSHDDIAGFEAAEADAVQQAYVRAQASSEPSLESVATNVYGTVSA